MKPASADDAPVDVPPELLDDLDELANHLEAPGAEGYEYPGWATALRECRRKIAAGDPNEIEQLLSMFGGMGSPNALILDETAAAVLLRVRTAASSAAQQLRSRSLRTSRNWEKP